MDLASQSLGVLPQGYSQLSDSLRESSAVRSCLIQVYTPFSSWPTSSDWWVWGIRAFKVSIGLINTPVFKIIRMSLILLYNFKVLFLSIWNWFCIEWGRIINSFIPHMDNQLCYSYSVSHWKLKPLPLYIKCLHMYECVNLLWVLWISFHWPVMSLSIPIPHCLDCCSIESALMYGWWFSPLFSFFNDFSTVLSPCPYK